MNQEMVDRIKDVLKSIAESVRKLSCAAYEIGKKEIVILKARTKQSKLFKREKAQQGNDVHSQSDADKEMHNPIQRAKNRTRKDFNFWLDRGCVLFIGWMLVNIIITVYFYELIDAVSSRPYMQHNKGEKIFDIIVIWVVLLFVNRLVYELILSSYERVKLLRQMRDEMRRNNACEESGFSREKEAVALDEKMESNSK